MIALILIFGFTADIQLPKINKKVDEPVIRKKVDKSPVIVKEPPVKVIKSKDTKVIVDIAPAKPKPQPHVAPKIQPIEVSVDRLRKFKTVIKTPPKQTPPHKDGHSWHWHPYYGWCSIPITIAPRVVVLPIDYILPRRVIVYEQSRVIYVVCPSCGETFTVELE